MAINVPIAYGRVKKVKKETLYSQWFIYSIVFCVYAILIGKLKKDGDKITFFSFSFFNFLIGEMSCIQDMDSL